MLLELSTEEVELVRSALCNKAMKELCKAHAVQHEAKEKGLEDNTSWIWMETRKSLNSIIDRIDAQ